MCMSGLIEDPKVQNNPEAWMSINSLTEFISRTSQAGIKIVSTVTPAGAMAAPCPTSTFLRSKRSLEN